MARLGKYYGSYLSDIVCTDDSDCDFVIPFTVCSAVKHYKFVHVNNPSGDHCV